MESYIVIFFAIFLVSYGIAELWGRSRHIGFGWAYVLLVTGILPGLIAISCSPSAKKDPSESKVIFKIIGWLIITLLVLKIIIQTIFFYSSQEPVRPDIVYSIQGIVIGFYLVILGKGEIVNDNPKFYFEPNKKERMFEKNLNSEYYFILENGKKSLPLSLNDLKNKRIEDSTLVWRNGLDDWMRAKDIEELRAFVISSPPPVPKM